MRTWKKKLCETAIVLGCLIGVIMIGASSDGQQQMAADEGVNVAQEQYILSEAN